MKQLLALIKRNCKLFFKDKGMFLASLISPAVLLVLYITFLANVYKNTLLDFVPKDTSNLIINGIVGGELSSALLAVSCVTVAFCSNLLMVQDKVNGTRNDLTISPIKESTLAFGYYISTVIVTLIVCYVSMIICFIYIACIGWFITFSDILLIMLDIFLLVLFGTALSSIINLFLKTQGQISAVGTIVSAGYGFLCGAYMPISSFNPTLRKILSFLPGTYGTSLIKNHMMQSAINEVNDLSWPSERIEALKDALDCNIYFFDQKVSIIMMYYYLIASIVVLLAIYIVLNFYQINRKNKSN
jgi:ABC-2 type transporter